MKKLLATRLPFAGLFLAAAAGIVTADRLDVGSVVFAAACLACLVVWTVRRGTVWILLASGCAFGAVHLWQTTESSSRRFAESLGSGSRTAVLEMRVLDEPSAFGAMRLRFAGEVLSLVGGGPTVGRGVRLAVLTPRDAPVARGAVIRVRAALRAIPPPRNPEAFDARAWFALRGIYAEAEVPSVQDVTLLRAPSAWSLGAVADRCRSWMHATLREGIGGDPVVCELLAGMVLGITAAIPDDLQEDFRNTGTFHLFSVSGLHVGMIGVLLWGLMMMLGVGRRTAVCVVIPALFFYALVTGWKPPSIRAAVMAAIFLSSLFVMRPPVPVNSLFAAGVLILAGWTSELFNPGFQLSFFVVLAILLLAGPVSALVKRMLAPDPFIPVRLHTQRERFRAGLAAAVAPSIGVSLAAWIGSLPLILAYFHLVSFSALIANLVVIPVAFLIMATALTALGFGLVSAFLAAVFNNANLVFTHVLLAIVQAAAALPGSHVYVGGPPRAPVAVTVFDVGAGGATAVEAGGRLWWLDAGADFDAKSVLVPWMHSRGRKSPDGVILSHGDARHIGGVARLLREASEASVLESPVDDRSRTRQKLRTLLDTSGLERRTLSTGESIDLAPGVTLVALHPSADVFGRDADDKVLVLRLETPGGSVLFLSDASFAAQRRLLALGPARLRSDVMVIGRPRGGALLDEDLLRAVAPRVVVSTVAGFPENEPFDPLLARRIERAGAAVFRQDETGAVCIEFADGRLSVSGFRDGRFLEWAPSRPARYAP